MGDLKGKIKDYTTSYLFVIPGIILFILFNIYPFIQSYTLSFRDWTGYNLISQAPFVGFQNYGEVFKDQVFWDSIFRVAKVTGAVVLIEVPLALILGVLAVNITRNQIYRLIYFIPTILSPIIVGMMWKWMFDAKIGVINQFLGVIGLDGLKQAWLAQSETAMGAITVTFIWQTFGTYFLLILVGLTGIDNQLYEAAVVEGSTAFQTFVYITLPLMIPTIILVAILLMLNSMQIFGQVVIMTNGGPGYATEVPSLRILKEAFENSRMSYATALSVVFGLILVVFAMLQLYVSRRYRNRLDS